MPKVRLVGPDGEQVGVVDTQVALDTARQAGLDLVEIASHAQPPVCKIMDYGRWLYEQSVKAREARRSQQAGTVKEIKFRPKIAPGDYATKVGHVVRFLTAGSKVRLTVMFRGREQHRPELGRRLLAQVSDDVAALATVEQHAVHEGRNMVMLLVPARASGTGGPVQAR